MAEETQLVQVNTSITQDDEHILRLMMSQSGYDNRSAFVRWLIRREWSRRNQVIRETNDVEDSTGEKNE